MIAKPGRAADLSARLQDHWWTAGSAGDRRRFAPWWVWPLLPLSLLYRGAAQAAAWWGDRMAQAQGPAAVPTVVVGNWVVGGAGKTPTTLALLEHLKARGWSPGVVSRGYGRHTDDTRLIDTERDAAADVGDEPLLLARRGQVPVVVGRDRCAARDQLLGIRPEVDIIVADDGLQHRRLWRDVEVVVVDERGAGNGWCLPAGPLREPVPARMRPKALLLYSAGHGTTALAGHVAQRELVGVQPLSDWMQGHPLPPHAGWQALRGARAHAAAGIAVPERFFSALRQQGLELDATHALPDHHGWLHMPWPATTTDAIVTEKDAVKLDSAAAGSTRIWVARLDLRLPLSFTAALDDRLEPRRRRL